MTTEYKPAVGPFWAFTRICLNNWHYISRKTLTLNEEINFYRSFRKRKIHGN